MAFRIVSQMIEQRPSKEKWDLADFRDLFRFVAVHLIIDTWNFFCLTSAKASGSGQFLVANLIVSANSQLSRVNVASTKKLRTSGRNLCLYYNATTVYIIMRLHWNLLT